MYVDVTTGEECTPCKEEPPFEDDETKCSSSPILPKLVCDSLPTSVSPPLSLNSCPTPSKDDELAEIKSEITSIKDEPLDPEDETKMDVEDEEYMKMMNDVGDDPEDIVDEEEEEDVEPADNDEEAIDEEVESNVNGLPEECDYGSDESDDEADFEDYDVINLGTVDKDPCPKEELPDRQEECENLPEDQTQIKEEVPNSETMNTVLDESSKMASDDSDSEDSESSSSSSSCSGSESGSDSSCSSSDSSDDEDKDQNQVDEDHEIGDTIEKDIISEE